MMATRVTPVPDRFTVTRPGEPDRLAPAIAVPAAPDTESAPDLPLPTPTTPAPERVPAGAP